MDKDKPIIQQFQDELNAVVDRYRNEGITFGEAIGSLEIVKLDLHSELLEEEDELGGVGFDPNWD